MSQVTGLPVVSEEENKANKSEGVQDDQINRLLFYIALIVLGIAVIALSAAFIACLIQK